MPSRTVATLPNTLAPIITDGVRLAIKFAAALTGGMALVLGIHAALHVREIAQLQEREIRDDAAILSQSLASAVEELWRAGERDRADEFIERANARRSHTFIHLARPQTPIARGRVHVEKSGGPRGWSVIATAPVDVPGSPSAAVQIERRLPDERHYFASVLWTQAQTTFLAALVSGLIAFALGVFFLSRPLRQLSRLAHRVTDGDFSVSIDVRQQDEIGTLARELETMTRRLAASHAREREERRARTAALDQLRHADRLSTLGKLASGMAHELGTPLNVVAGRASMIANQSDVASAVKNNANIITEQVRRMTGIIQELLDFARAKPLERRDVNVRTVVEQAVSLMEPLSEARNVTFRVEGFDDRRATVDAGKILQVLTNLMVNAIQAMPSGGTVTLVITSDEVAKPDNRHSPPGTFVEIRVRDEGVGIPEDRMSEVFREFFTTKGGGGTGLGLSVSHGIVREHGGWIDVESKEGVGSCFTVYLPQRVDAHANPSGR